jgi:surface antigen
MKKIICVPVVLVLTLTGCGQRLSNAEMVGMAVGGILGGYAGSQIGHGLWNTAWMAVGAASGVAGGYVTARKLGESDMAHYKSVTGNELAAAERGDILNWTNPETGNSGIIRPVRTYASEEGNVCKGYRSTVAFSDVVQSGSGSACLTTDGSWQIVADDFS